MVNKNGQPAHFKNARDAELAAWRAKDKVEQTVMRRMV